MDDKTYDVFPSGVLLSSLISFTNVILLHLNGNGGDFVAVNASSVGGICSGSGDPSVEGTCSGSDDAVGVFECFDCAEL